MAWNPNQGDPNNPNVHSDPSASNPYGSSAQGTPPAQEGSYDPNQTYTEFGPQASQPNPAGQSYAAAPQYQIGQQYPAEQPYQQPYSAGPQYQASQQYPARQPYQQPYSAGPQYQAGFYPPPAAPRPLGQALRELPSQYWRVLTRPGARTFAEEMGKASWEIVVVQLAIYAVVMALISFLSSYLGFLFLSAYSSNSTIVSSSFFGIINAIFSFGTILIVPISFFIGSGILFGLAKAFKGQGKFVTQNYTLLLFEVPLGILGGVLGLIPFLNILTGLAIGVYRIILAIFSIMAVHRLSGGKATAVVLIPIGAAILLYLVFIVVLFAILFSTLPHH